MLVIVIIISINILPDYVINPIKIFLGFQVEQENEEEEL